MYCSKCGQQIPNDSLFCPECGNNCKENSIQTKDSNQHTYINYTLDAIKHPIATIKSKKEEVSIKANLLYVAIIALIVPFVQVLSFRSFSFNIVKSIINLTATIRGSKLGIDELIQIKKEFSDLMDTYVPFNNVYIFDLLRYILFYGIIILLIYIFYRCLIKSQFSLKAFTKVLAVSSIINLVFVILSSLILSISVLFSFFVSIVGGILTIFILIVGLNYVLNGDDKLGYMFAIFYAISIFITNYISIKYLISTIQFAFSNFLNYIL